MRTITVGLGSRPYDVLIGENLVHQAGELLLDLLRGRQVAIVSDATVAARYGTALTRSLVAAGTAKTSLIVLPPGEETKSFEGLAGLCDQLLALGLERGDVLIALGGGVIGDLAGFAAAIYKRGVDFIQIPTTLLAQVDSSVGGKTAIDTPRGKNLIGAFHQPLRVLADLSVLASLPDRELRCGYAEIVKYGLVGDAAFFAWLEQRGPAVLSRDPQALAHAVQRSVEMKAKIVAADELEKGARALLNLGHTFGHALEAETGFSGRLLHGEAVALGTALALRFSVALGFCSPSEAERGIAVLSAASLPTALKEIWPTPPSSDRLITHMAQDKKASGGKLVFVLVRTLGDGFLAKDVEPQRLRDFLAAQGAG